MFSAGRRNREHARAVADVGSTPSIASVEHLKTNWFWSSDTDGNLTYISDWVLHEFDAKAGDLLGQPLTNVFHSENFGEEGSLGLPIARRRSFRGINVRSRHDAVERIWTISGNPQRDDDGEFLGYAGIGTDITAMQESVEEISRLASYDPLTGLRNRRGVSSLVGHALAKAERHDTPFAVLVVDLDRFKQINDTLGHPVGDALLQQVAERLIATVGTPDCIGRIGGDEFQIVLPGRTDRADLAKLADAIIESISQPYTIGGSRCVIGASVGMVIAPENGVTSDELARNVDLALYAAKEAGRGRSRFFVQDMHEAAEDRRQLEQDLLDALDRGELEVHYQPLVYASSNMVAGFEALLRWNHPDRGRISPALFIPIAEETNLIAQLGEWTLRQACADAAKWPDNLRIAVNLSPIQFANPNLPQIVVSALAHSGLPPRRLELEITESVFLGDSKETDATFSALKKIGVRLALDDFGTGYSSLGYLKSAPFDKIKIDQSFVRGVTEPGSRNGAIISSIVALAKALDMETTAEGIETVDQLDAMRALDVTTIQGYLYSLPVSASIVNDKVGTGRWEIEPIGPARQRRNRVATFRRIGAVHGDHCYPVILRNLSATGALIQGLVDVPIGTRFVMDFGNRQWALATVRRSKGDYQGIEFDDELVSDGEGGYSVRYRVSSLMMAQIGEIRAAGQRVEQQVPDRNLRLPVFNTTLS